MPFNCFKVALCVLALIGSTICFATLKMHPTLVEPGSQVAATMKTTLSPQEKKASTTGSTKRTGIGLQREWPGLRFHRPVHLCGAADGTDRIFVVEQDGIVRVFSNGDSDIKSTAIFLDIRDKVSRLGNEEGLIGFAFHPDYKNNGEFFVHYSSKVNDPFGTISRFRVSPRDPNRADPESEEILLEVKQPFRNHNGGAIAFGHDGFLYLSLGDGGSANDPLGNGQDLSSLLGKILRIDVNNSDKDLKYAIPSDNPFVGKEGARGEIYALGLRNVWRFSIDRKTNEIWAGDVGQDKFDEISLISKGGNYGWNRHEGFKDFATDTEMATPKHIKPVAAYGREWGLSITGGNVYRGMRFPELDGSYFYGDYVSGNMWRIKKNQAGSYKNELVRRSGRSISAFGEDDAGELFLLSFDGGIYRVVPSAEPENSFASWPAKISETGLFASMKDRKMADDVVPYEVNSPFWSDDADKLRYFVLPEGRKFEYRANGSWTVPVGGTLVKNFSRFNGRQMLETRLIMRTETGWEAATYVWNKQGTDAILHPEGQQFEMYTRVKEGGKQHWRVDSWHAPSSSECASCHVDAAGYVLGLNTAQLNRNSAAGKNQITDWVTKGYLNVPNGLSVNDAAKYCSTTDVNADLNERARVYLEVNCAMCHRPDGPGNANIDLRYSTKLSDMKMINAKPAQGDHGINEALLICPGDADRSLLHHRIATLGAGRMPNIGSNQVDRNGAKLISDWINSLPKEESTTKKPDASFYFKAKLLTKDQNEGIDLADFNNDGSLDVIAGRNWFAGPDFTARPVRTIADWNGYVESNGDHAMDVDGDGFIDLVSGSFVGTKVHWYKNPGKEGLEFGSMWKQFLLGDTRQSQNEASFLRDIDGDGASEWITNSWNKTNPVVVWKFKKTGGAKQPVTFTRHQVNGSHNGHGMGFGDINNDGREDILVESGWFERPESDPLDQEWEFHNDWNGLHASCPMIVRDIDSDGKNDLIWGKGHDFGLYLWKGKGPNFEGKLQFEEHLIDDSYSQPHALHMADLDGDGNPELITGKRVRAHNGNDPGGKDMPCMYFYSWDANADSFKRGTIDEGHVGTGLQIRTGDLNNDGRTDIAVAGKDGTWVLFNALKK